MIGLVAFLCGLVFALGLGVGGMTQPPRVLAFLDVAGAWDPTLAFVMAGAVAVYTAAARIAARQERPAYATTFVWPTRHDLDVPLVFGAAIFGVGWGLAGLCPGPALTALGSGAPAALMFVAAMLAGMAAAGPSTSARPRSHRGEHVPGARRSSRSAPRPISPSEVITCASSTSSIRTRPRSRTSSTTAPPAS